MKHLWIVIAFTLSVAHLVTAQDSTATIATTDLHCIQAILDSNGQTTKDLSKIAKFEEGRVVSLDLTSAEVTKPTYIKGLALLGNLAALKELSLARNDLTNLPEELSKLSNLRKLNLAYNSLSSLPPSFAQLSALEHIDLRYNKFTAFPGFVFGLSKIRYLQLWGNLLIDLPEDLKLLTSLRELYLKDNRLQMLPRSIMSMPALVYLDFGYNKLCNLPPDLHAWMLKRDSQYKAGQRCW